ncbi:MAG TPA: hypothetical protein VEC14_05075 [Reyranellaceae bacterium]|nr:hypothetical protein [Reyranellaceae bacterium]
MWDLVGAWLTDWRNLAILAGAIGLLYLARDAAHRLIRLFFLFIAHSLRLIERWMHSGAIHADARRHRLVAGLAEDELQPRIPRETRAATNYIERLNRELPVVRDALQMQLNELQDSHGRNDPREKRHALQRIARALPATQKSVGRLCGIEDRAREQVSRLGTHVEEHRKAIASYGATLAASQYSGRETKLGHSSGVRFLFALVLIAAVGVAGWLNFALLERPMAEIVGDSYLVMGVPIYRLAALAIIVLEVAVGMVLLEAVGGTTMFPQFERLEHRSKLRIAIVVTMALALLVLATIEAALALTRDDLARMERELMGTLAGAPPSETAQSVSDIARYAQAAFGFVIPFAMAFLGFALEMLVRNGRVVIQAVVVEALHGLSFITRLLRRLTVGAMGLVLALYDLVIFLPLALEQKVRQLRKVPS